MITLEFINKRTMLYVDEKVNFYDYDLDVYEELLREFKDDLIKQALPPTIFFNPGTILRKEYVLKRKFCATEIFVFIDDKKEIPLKKKQFQLICIYVFIVMILLKKRNMHIVFLMKLNLKIIQ